MIKKKKKIKLGEKINICIPTGNFGHILGAFIAKKMGLPLGKLICCSNENNIISKFFETGVFDIQNTKFKSSISPSIDILIPNNIERLLYLITEDPKLITEWYNSLSTNKKFTINEETLKIIKENFYFDYCNENECKNTISSVIERFGYIIDPHTSVAFNCYEKLCKRFENLQNEVTVITATAHPLKFITTIFGILNIQKDDFDSFTELVKNLNLKNQKNNLDYSNFIHEEFLKIIKETKNNNKINLNSNLNEVTNFILQKLNFN